MNSSIVNRTPNKLFKINTKSLGIIKRSSSNIFQKNSTTAVTTPSKCLSKRDTLIKILSSQIDDPLVENLTPRHLATSSFFSFSDENTPPLCSTKYTDKDENIKSMKHSDMTKLSSFPQKNNGGPISNNINKKIQDDLNSPSANSRMRAIKALRSPGTNNYLFDIPHEEQYIITEDDKPQSLPKLEDIFKKIVVYVEVRTEEDNRSAGIKEVIKKMGAKINNNLLRDTTHVVFKDGLLSTYNKAKNWNIPIVSILWIEACKRNLQIIDPKLYPISNLDRYENPELYKRMRRVKSMQPDAEDKRNKIKVIKKADIEMKIKPSVCVPRKPKDKLNEIFAEFHEKLISTPESNDDYVPFQSKLLERIKNSPFVMKKNNKSKNDKNEFQLSPKNSKTDFQSSIDEAKKVLKFDTPKKNVKNVKAIIDNKKSEKLNSESDKPGRRRNTLLVSKKEKPVINKIGQITKKNSMEKSTKRQTQMFQHFNIETQAKNNSNFTNLETTDNKTNNSEMSLDITQNFSPIKRRRTLYSVVPMEITKTSNELEKLSESESNTSSKKCVQDEQLPIWNDNCVLTPINKSSVLDSHKNTLIYSSDRMINKRRTIFDISMEIIDKRLQNINEASKIQSPKVDTIVEENIEAETNQVNTIGNLRVPSTACSDNNNNIFNSNNTETKSKKRKLFAPNDLTLEAMSEDVIEKTNRQLNEISLLNQKKKKKENLKTDITKNVNRRRTIGVPSLNMENKISRRSSADFETLKVNEMKISVKKPKISKYVIVSTNMHNEQINFIKKASEILNFTIENEVTDQTTHVVSLEPGRTINLLKGLIRGLWILKYEWILESVNEKKFVEEEPYELRSFSDAVEISRSERQAFGINYKMDLFSSLLPIYVAKECNVPSNTIKELIRLCSGKLVDNEEEAKYIIGEYSANKICVQPQWILDSITNKKLQKYAKYQIKL